MPRLVLVRHGQSQWNLENRFTGWWDVDLTEKGIVEAIAAHDPERAGTAMRVHLAHVAETLKETTGARSQHTAQVARG